MPLTRLLRLARRPLTGPLTALRDGTDGGNGVYRYGASGFPNSTFRSSNYWVDVVFDTSANDTTAPTVVAQVPAPGSSGVAVGTSVSATFSEAVVGSHGSMELRGPGNTLVSATTAYNSGSQTETLTPNAPLANSTTYTATVSGAKDSSNNTMSPVTWSFTTAAPPPPPPDQGPGGPIAIVTSNNPYSKYLAEILRTEGLNEFATIDVGSLTAATLAQYDAVVLGEVSVSGAQAATLTTWVNGGGNLIAMRPDSALSTLLGITAASGTGNQQRLSQGRYGDSAWSGHRLRHHPIPRRCRPLHALGCASHRDDLLECHNGDDHSRP